jgi:HicB family
VQLEGHIHAIQTDLASAAALGDDSTAEAARRLSEALGSTLHLRLLDLLGEAAAEIGPQLASGRIDVRLAGRDPELVVVMDEPAEPNDIALGAGEEYRGRITLRLPETVKSAVEAAADKEGISTNAWLVQTIARALHTTPSGKSKRKRLQGFAQG